MNKVAIELTEDQAQYMLNALHRDKNYVIYDVMPASHKAVSSYHKRVITKVTKALAKAKS